MMHLLYSMQISEGMRIAYFGLLIEKEGFPSKCMWGSKVCKVAFFFLHEQ